MASCHTHATLPGGAAVPAAPTKQTVHILPRNSQNSQKRLVRNILPQISQMVRLRRVLPQNSRISQKRMAEKSLPQMPTDG